MKQLLLLAVLTMLGAFPASAQKLVHYECREGYVAMSFTTLPTYPLPGEAAYPEHLMSLDQFAAQSPFICGSDKHHFRVDVTYSPASARGMCGAQDTAKLRLSETADGAVARVAWIDKSHGWDCINSQLMDRQIRLAGNAFRICSKANDPKRDPSLLDMTGYDCVDLKEFN